MKSIVVLFGVLALCFADGDYYTTKYDNIDLNAVLGNPRLVANYIKCLLDQGRCNDEGALLKEIVPDALTSGCSKCNEKQRVAVGKVVRFLIHDRPADWQQLVNYYDPNGIYRHNYQQYYDQVL